MTKQTTSLARLLRFRWRLVIILAVAVVPAAWAQQASTDEAGANAQIRTEGMERSQIMQILQPLTDLYGPRLTGSPTLEQAGDWVLGRLESYGLENAQAEPWDWGYPGWENVRFSAHIVEPVQDQLTCEVLAWTPGTNGTVVAPAVHLVPPQEPTQAELDAYFDSLRTDIEGAVVLLGRMEVPPITYSLPLRRDDADVAADYEPNNVSERRSYSRSAGRDDRADVLSARQVERQVTAFLRANEAAVQVNPARMDDGLIRAFSNRTFDPSSAVPTVVMRNEDYGRIARLIAGGHEVTLEFTIVNRLYPKGKVAYNYTAEIVGTEKPEEVIMLGGHLDSWHAGTGATDNAAGVAVMMEAVRILKALGLEPRRTIRIALWTGEEQGLLGSQAYVEQHFGTFEEPKDECETFGGYVNVDSGTGKLRGATVFGPRGAAQVLEEILVPFEDLGVAGARPSFSRRLGGSDHTSFNRAGLPGISMGQDPIRYFSHTWHTNLDTYEHILEDDVKQAAVVAAALVYHLAMRDELLPRFTDDDMPPGSP